MSKIEAMLTDRPGYVWAADAGVYLPVWQALRPPKPKPQPPPRRGPLLRWVRQGARAHTWRPWWLLGAIEVVTYAQPALREVQLEMAFEPSPHVRLRLATWSRS